MGLRYNYGAMPRSTRRQALVGLAAGAVAARAADHNPNTLTGPRYEALLGAVDTIIPETDTPGAAQAGVAKMIDEDAAGGSWRWDLDEALDRLMADGFSDSNDIGRQAILADYMNATDERRAHFKLLKDLTVDYYYSTEIGLAEELGYKGNTYLAEFPGCTHPEHLGEKG